MKPLLRMTLVAAIAILATAPWVGNGAQASTRQQRFNSFMAGCKRILDANPNEDYLMTDLNGNGFPEMWISYNVGRHADYCWHVYHSVAGQPKEVYSCPFGPIENYGSFVLVGDNDGDALRLTYDGNRIFSSWLYGQDVSYDAITTRDRSQFYYFY